MNNKSQCGSTQGPPLIEKTIRGTIEQVQTKTQEISMEEGEGQDTCINTQMSESYEPLEAQRKRIGEQESGSRKKVKAYKKPMVTSFMADDVELIATKVEYRLSEMCENAKNHKASILEKIQELKTTLEKLKVGTKKQQQKTTMPAKEGAPVGETVQITAQGIVNFWITPEMMFIDVETMHRALKKIAMLDLALPNIPTKALYKLQVSVAREI
jgi:hypothetical protein